MSSIDKNIICTCLDYCGVCLSSFCFNTQNRQADDTNDIEVDEKEVEDEKKEQKDEVVLEGADFDDDDDADDEDSG